MPRFSAQQVYSLISEHNLTAEQAAAIEGAPVDSPSLVVAGAGSGKTELMMVRVLYLVANGYATPEQILGLTFTRKAANELSARIQQGLIRLRESELWPAELEQDFLPAKIATYNSFGNEIFRSVALELGYEQEAQLISQATALALARELIESEVELSEEFAIQLDTIADRVVALSAEMTDNLVSAEQISSYFDELAQRVGALPKTKPDEIGRFGYTDEYLASLASAGAISNLVAKYRRVKFERNYLEFADQVALSLAAADSASLNLEYRFVLLDEYQDTSPIQSRLLAKLFHGKPVMAVGDPNQSIYAWRGASSANLADFFSDFGPGETFTLSTSWRSGTAILQAANAISGSIPGGRVEAVQLSAGRDHRGLVTAAIYQDQESEAREVCSLVAKKITPDLSAAVLFRTKEAMRLYSEELTKLGVTHEITGLSALLEQPEVLDLISVLRVLVNPEATVELMRIASGPRYQLGPGQIALLHRLAVDQTRFRAEVESDKPLTLVEIIDELSNPRIAARSGLDELTIAKLVRLAKVLSALRTQLSLSLVEIAWLVIREFEIDIELYAHSDASNPLANLQAFVQRMAEYEASAQRPSVSGFVSWLDLAAQKESFELPKSAVKRGVVQLLTVHAAKGLEWDFVAIPNLNEGSFPSPAKEPLAWLAGGKLPPMLRLDAAELPVAGTSYATQREFKQTLEEYKVEVAAHHLIEERRLAYVAITRAAQELHLSASYFKRTAAKPRAISRFLKELIELDLAELSTAIKEAGDRPEFAMQQRQWPADPLTAREAWEAAAEVVSSASPAKLDETLELALLLRERELPNFLAKPKLPLRLSASAIVRLLADAEKFAEDLARPMPQPYSEAAERGTRFHAGLEEAFRSGSELELSGWSEEEKELGINFLGSRFASLEPILIEQSIEFALAGTVVVCQLDAVFESDGEYLIVDWKSGSQPTEQDLNLRSIQLALYRIGLCRMLGVGPERVKASFYFAADGSEVNPKLQSEAEIATLLAGFRTARQG